MMLSKKTLYGLRALLELVPTYPGGQLTVTEIARKQGISKKFLDHVFADLNRGGIAKSRKGVFGGYSLCRSPSEIKLLEIIEAIEGPNLVSQVAGDEGSWRKIEEEKVNHFILDLEKSLRTFLSSQTLHDLFEKQVRKGSLHFSI